MAPTGAALRRALVQPALKCGYRFEDEALVDEMLAEVERRARRAAAAGLRGGQLWERRDRERGCCTREAYTLIGGVGGALAQHAEATLERIGRRACWWSGSCSATWSPPRGRGRRREREELLSVFAAAERGAAAEVLDALVDARLLTSYELPRWRVRSAAATASRSSTSRCSPPGRGWCTGRPRTRKGR